MSLQFPASVRVIDRFPSTDERGVFQAPTHVSFWKINSFFYDCVDFPEDLKQGKQAGFRGEFKVDRLENLSMGNFVWYVKAD